MKRRQKRFLKVMIGAELRKQINDNIIEAKKGSKQ
jgi:hypothetical protein